MDERERKLAEDNHNLIYSFLKKHRLSIEEYYGVAAVGLCRAAEKYREGDTRFSTFAYLCMMSAVRQEMHRNQMKKRIPPEKIISLEREITYANGDSRRVMDCIPAETNMESEALQSCAFGNAMKRLKKWEREVIFLLLCGYTLQEAGDEFGCSNQNVSLIKKKFQAYLKEEEQDG